MTTEAVRSIRPANQVDAEIQVPPSKSYTNRALIAAALADGTSTIINPSRSDDAQFMLAALREFGVQITEENGTIEIKGTNGILETPSKEILIGNAGTAIRFLATFACLAPGKVVLNGDNQMQQRPINDLVEALRSSGIKCSSNNGCPPVEIHGGKFNGGNIVVNASVSSQFVSSLLLSAPYAKHPLMVKVNGKLSSMPYVDMTLHVMRMFGAEVQYIDPMIYQVSNIERYVAQEFQIEGDATSATYFLAAAAITQGRVTITNLSPESLQGDIQFLKILEEMGCKITRGKNSIELQGTKLHGIEVDMNELPDCVPTLAILAAFAHGPTTISNVQHLQFKETNRLTALVSELSKIGAKVILHEDGLTIYPQPLRRATIETYNDHRMAMSFAVGGLGIKGIVIKNPMCVTKSFPNFWDEFKKIEGKE